MGVLGSQPERDAYRIDNALLDAFLHDIKVLSDKHSISTETAIEAARVLELKRKNDISVQAGDYFDEQLGGFGDILRNIAAAIESKT
ncbi:MAG: hypothetical protein HOE35_02420 [Candidatus Ruthia sp.]|nr:hypothetical protein [Candidatus Ruthturnera sp.]